jgi:hypothetical protein
MQRRVSQQRRSMVRTACTDCVQRDEQACQEERDYYIQVARKVRTPSTTIGVLAHLINTCYTNKLAKTELSQLSIKRIENNYEEKC